MGFGPLSRYIDRLKKLQFPLYEIIFKKANRTFYFGGDHKAISSWTVYLPIFVNHKFGLVQAFLLRGETNPYVAWATDFKGTWNGGGLLERSHQV